jgi:hypothetical protein
MATPDDGLAQLRVGNCGILQAAFTTAAADVRAMIGSNELFANETAEIIGRHAVALEKMVFDKTTNFRERKREYAVLARSLALLLRRPIGPHPHDVAAVRILCGELSLTAAVDMAPTTSDLNPRDIIRRMFAATLMRASPLYRESREWVLEDSCAIEKSCFNAVVRSSKRSEDPPRRQWDSPVFTDMYSARCGKVNILLDPTSSVSIAYGASIVPRLLDGTLCASDIGDATSCELCPIATLIEREEIAKRSVQTIQEKVSNLFKCPKCSVRKCVYREIHTRGLDESPDYFCRCVCGFRFQGYN